jgi:hypothetical protein
MRRSIYNECLPALSLTALARTASANGTTVDRLLSAEQFRSSMLIVNVGTVTDGTHAFKLQDSPNDSDWTDCVAADLQGSAISVTSANDEAVFVLGYTGSGRYLRAVVTVTGSPATGGVYSATIVSSGHSTPVR